jgi:hypothetical protein
MCRAIGDRTMDRMNARRITTLAALLLALAASPAEALEPLGPSFRVSKTGPDTFAESSSTRPAVAHNPELDQYLFVWEGEPTNGEIDVYGRLYRADGTPLGEQFRVSSVGKDGDPQASALEPAVAYDETGHEYLVVWSATGAAGLAAGEKEIFGQRLDAAGTELGGDFRVSEFGPPGDASYAVGDPAVTWNRDQGDYLVAWSGGAEGDEGGRQVHVRRIWWPVGPLGKSVPISTTGYASNPAIAYAEGRGRYLVTWDVFSPGTPIPTEIHGQLLDATAAQIGPPEPALSAMTALDPGGDARSPAVTWNPARAEFLVAWVGDRSADQSRDVFGRRVAVGGSTVGPEIRISEIDGAGVPGRDALPPQLVYGPRRDEYVVAWPADAPPLADEEIEVFAQRLTGAGEDVGPADVRISSVGPEGDDDYRAENVALAASPARGELLVAWSGRGSEAPLKAEVYATRVAVPPTGGGEGAGGGGAGADGGAAADHAPPRLTLRAPRRMRISPDRRLRVRVACDEACRVSVSARLRVRGPRRTLQVRQASRSLAAGSAAPVDLRLSRRAASRVRRALRRGRRVTASFRASAHDAAANAASSSVRVRLVRR